MDELAVIYEDEVLLACDKPAGVIVHADGTGAPTLTDAVAAHLAATGRAGVRPQAVQRLDRET
ncbi:MAG TPA: RluA family pseudouridine synthase, partial [Olsenella sp.]|nr:RluA family pseudouridine synthase [Olsenella sp.]